MKKTLVELKALFETGDKPTQQDFIDLIDTLEDASQIDIHENDSTAHGIDSVLTTLELKAAANDGTLTNPTITNYTESLYAPAAGSAFTVDLANGTVQKFTTNANTTITLPASVVGKSYTILVSYGGTHTITFAGGTAIKWAGGTAPYATSVSGKVDIYVFECDGTNTYGASGGSNY